MSAKVELIGVMEGSEGTWHGLENSERGLWFPKNSLPSRVTVDLGMDFQVVEVVAPTFTFQHNKITYSYSNPDEKFWMIPEAPFLTEPHKLRSVSRATPIQNMEMANLLDRLVESEAAKNLGVHLEIAGVLDQGRYSWYLLKMPDFLVNNMEDERHLSYLLVGNDHNGTLYFGDTGVRVVCWNTFSMAVQSRDLLRISHTGDPLGKLEMNTYLLELFLREQDTMRQELNTLFNTDLRKIGKPEEIAQDFFMNVFPDPKPPRAKRSARLIEEHARKTDGKIVEDVKEYVSKAEQAYENAKARQHRKRFLALGGFHYHNEQYPTSAETAYALFQSVTDLLSNKNDLLQQRGNQEDLLARQFFGDMQEETALAFVEAKKLSQL